ncbi:amino acid ABC transporter [Malaciobacter molluscorum LMG 25693]|uniref:Amino acid ABC transporter n=1 Tax=Malaciobacter molluscorum LMG 25693 TaxID=870501 RepID=A0A2G1DKZ7_9BACT|nr:HD domain-containing phosphohydrolase [Malaciobacter molluscorum]AXX92758.1 c-di-GMP phosphodiesterase, class II (HD-GYP domain) [Malaciobacter molluscorum LMG 25693]PHO19172.1 amino acid ABC transporter [Malaciobacter molluscorum LMG 25693]
MKKKNRLFIKIRPTISFTLITCISIVIIVSLSLQYYFLKQLAFDATKNSFSNIALKVKNKIQELDKTSNNIIEVFELYDTSTKIAKKNEKHPLLKLFTTIIKNNTYIYSLYVGNKNKDFFEVINLDTDENLRKRYNATQKTKWLILKIYKNDKGKRVEFHEYLDKNLNLLKTVEINPTYDPTIRPWFIQAQKSNTIIKTAPYEYVYSASGAKGITYSKRINNSDTIISIDLLLTNIGDVIKKEAHKSDKIILFKKNGNIETSINFKDKITDPKYKKIFNLIQDNVENKHFTLNIDKTNYYIYFSKIDSIYNNKDYLAILTPVNIIMKPYSEKIMKSFLLTILVLTIIIPLIWIATKVLVTPVLDLMKENKKIINRDFLNVKIIDTHIKELYDLSVSLSNMSKSIKEYEEKQKELMDSFIKILASAIDAKSKYTGKHCERVPIITMLIAKKAHECNEGIFKNFKFANKDEERELSIAAWLHDCGKVTTPEYVIDKATKLETIYNRIHEIRTRFEVIHRDLTIKMYENILNGANEEKEKKTLEKEHQRLQEEFEIVANANIGSEFMKEEDIKKINEIANRTWIRYFDNTIGLSLEEEKHQNKTNTPAKEKLLNDKKEHIIKRDKDINELYSKYKFKLDIPKYQYNLGEIYNLTIEKGTLNQEERFKINEHIIMSIIMLEKLSWPNNLKKVPEYAGAHHETLIGTGYPRKLKKQQMSIPARIMAVADIFEALTASDRPYKKAKKLSESIEILASMAKNKHIDEDIFKLFLSSNVYLEYAKKYLKKEQLDEVDISKYL